MLVEWSIAIHRSATLPFQFNFRLMDLQTLDYMPLLDGGTGGERESTDGRAIPYLYGSELLRKSLAQESSPTTEEQKDVTFQEKSTFIEHNNYYY